MKLRRPLVTSIIVLVGLLLLYLHWTPRLSAKKSAQSAVVSPPTATLSQSPKKPAPAADPDAVERQKQIDRISVKIQSLEAEMKHEWEKLLTTSEEARFHKENYDKFKNWDYRHNYGEYALIEKWLRDDPTRRKPVTALRRHVLLREAVDLMKDPQYGDRVRKYFEDPLMDEKSLSWHQYNWNQPLDSTSGYLAPPEVIAGLLQDPVAAMAKFPPPDRKQYTGVVEDFTTDSVRGLILTAMSHSYLERRKSAALKRMEKEHDRLALERSDLFNNRRSRPEADSK